MPNTYSVKLGVKTPSSQVQYRMLDAEVTVSGEDFEGIVEEARGKLATALAVLANTLGETPPDELRPTLEEIHPKEEVAACYGESGMR